MAKTVKTTMKKTKASKPKARSSKAWAGRFSESTDLLAEELNASIFFDARMYKYDVRGSVAHAKVLKRAGVLTVKECGRIIKGLQAVEVEIDKGRLTFTVADEDIHMAIEKHLTEKIGVLGGKLHTGRSRNDQVALDVRLYLKTEATNILKLIKGVSAALVSVAGKNTDAIMPGYTHLQRAQPVLFAHHLLAYYEMLKRDASRLKDCVERFDELPLGSGALAGSPFALDRKYAAKLLGFKRVTENSMDSVSARDFVCEFLSSASILMMHLSRFSEELVLWSSQEFGFIEFSDAFSTGSSIMPQKKNPDMAELIRGKTGRVYGNLVSLLTVMKSLPMAYNKDMQEDKEPLFDTVDTVKVCLSVLSPMLKTMKVNKASMRKATLGGFLTATDAADYLATKGTPFRKAHEVAGRAVKFCIENNKTLEDLTLKEWQALSKTFDKGILKAVKLESSLNSRKVYGGTSTMNVRRRISVVRKELKAGKCW